MKIKIKYIFKISLQGFSLFRDSFFLYDYLGNMSTQDRHREGKTSV